MGKPRRKPLPKSVKVSVETRQDGICACGCLQMIGNFFWSNGPKPTNYDHRPPLALRPLNETETDYDPPQHDPEFIDALAPRCHAQRTYGGRSRGTSINSDAHAIAKSDRVELSREGKRKFRPMPGSRASGWKKPIYGPAVRRT